QEIESDSQEDSQEIQEILQSESESAPEINEPQELESDSQEILQEIQEISQSESESAINEPQEIESDSQEILQEIQEISQSESESAINEPQEIESDSQEDSQNESESDEPDPTEIKHIDPSIKYGGDSPDYDFTSGKRYVDAISTKTDFDRMLEELASISKDIIEHEADRFAKKYTGKFQGGFDKAEADAKKYDAFLGGYITNAAMILYDRGHREVAISKLEETRKILEARKKLEDETAAMKARVEEEDAVVDLSDILGLFGDG
ncbi:MAG: hypothetical protein IJT21_05440, partial [Synergistaceae bacterium]|nr:hypothetical protein [Synergistaceae bacterium]